MALRRPSEPEPRRADGSDEADALYAQLREVVCGRPATEADFVALERLRKLDSRGTVIEVCLDDDLQRECDQWRHDKDPDHFCHGASHACNKASRRNHENPL